MQHYGTASEIRRLCILAALCVVVGLFIGELRLTLLAGACVYIGYHLKHITRLVAWLQNRRLEDIPDVQGIWGQVYDQLIRQKRREIREKNRLKAVINRVEATTTALMDGVILLTRDHNLNWWNQASERLLGLKPADVGNAIINYIRLPEFVQYLDNDDFSLPLTITSPRDHEAQLEFQMTRFGEGEILVVVRDITRIYKLEEMRKDFVANVSHELRTPLTVIRGYLETLEDNQEPALKDNLHLQKALDQMQQQASRMTTLINDLTMLSKLETTSKTTKQQPVQLKPLLEMICSEAQTISNERQHKISLHCSLDITMLGNDRELHSAFSNLVTNAIKYSPPGKSIEINVTINLAGKLVVAVKDQGVGIEQQHISRLTERFYRVDASRSIQTGGTGLGLAIVKHILLRHDGILQIDSLYGRGSTFSCIFPSDRIIQQSALLQTKTGQA